MATTYVFGAGASIHAGYPLSAKMGEGLLEFMLNYETDRYKRSAQILIEWFGKTPNIEEMVTVLEERIEALKDSPNDRTTRTVLGNTHGQIAEALREWFRAIGEMRC